MANMANEAVEFEDDQLSRKVTYFLKQNVGTEKASANKVFFLLQDVLDRKNHLTEESGKDGPTIIKQTNRKEKKDQK
ncbi:hypothetical protein P5673_010612 [Acropora cervicornis]|uniref:Uncharacterized protein n=1 Tax=Acropora cervicornis TaxID=6130 RepID=A0AAD9QR18_ACRCE|nr:hypothetical protein P5673_010612 [Acropora cervicornis]